MRRGVVLFVLVVSVVGCTDSGHKAVGDACLLQPAEMAAIINAHVDAGVSSPGMLPQPGVVLCGYATSASFETVTIVVERPGQAAYEAAKTSAQSGAGPSVPFAAINGLGDNAFSHDDAVSVLRGDVYLIVQAQNPNSDFAAIAPQLARQALLHLS